MNSIVGKVEPVHRVQIDGEKWIEVKEPIYGLRLVKRRVSAHRMGEALQMCTLVSGAYVWVDVPTINLADGG